MRNSSKKAGELDCIQFPEYSLFMRTCRDGLSAIYPFKSRSSPDFHGWKFSPGWPPSYQAFGRMRSLLAIQDAIRLKPTRVLEVAAGGGGLAASLTKVGCSVVVNDLLEEQITGAIKEYCTGDTIKVVGGNMFDLSPIQLCKFDLVIACEVIEHVAHPEDLLNHLKKFLKPEGRILLTTPNGAHFRNNLPTYSEISDFDELESYQFKPDADGHLFLFTPQELSKLAETVGLQIEQISVWGTPMLSGHFGFRFMAGRFLTRAAYKTELLVQHMRSSKRERLCVALSAILRLP